MKQHRFVFVAALALLAACTNFKEMDAPDALTVDVKELSFPSGAATQSVTVHSGTKWTVNNKPEWVSVPSISSPGGFQWGVTFAVSENADYDRAGVIAINSGSGSANIAVSQQGKKGKYVAVESVSVSPSTLSMTVGETKKLSAVLSPSNASVKTVTWKSLNTAAATVDKDGNVTAVAAGEATIRVTTDDGNKTADCVVTVKAKTVAVTGVSLDKTTLTLTEGETATLTATVAPADATNKNVTWSSNNTNVATVSTAGVVTAKAAGSATITVTTADGSKKATCSVTVNAKTVAVTGVSLDKTTLTLTEGDTSTLTATVAPANATNKDVTWSSNNTTVATVSNTGVVTAKAAGNATITVTTVDGSKKATCAVTVNAKTVAVTGVSLDKTSLSLEEGETYTLTATVTPSNATDKSVSWSSSNTNVATVSNSGVVTAKTPGTTTITVTTTDGSKKATCSVTVTAKVIAVTGVSLNKTSLTLAPGGTETLTATVAPANATNKNVTWSSSNTSVATVSNSGVVTAKTVGSATITVTTSDGGKTAKCSVTVAVPVSGISLDQTALTLFEGENRSLIATISPSDATDKSVTWTSSNTSVATVSTSGVVSAKKAGSTVVTVRTTDGAKTATCAVTVKASSGVEAGHQWVDLGLSVKWATTNIGASDPEDAGLYFAWGGTESQTDYSWSSYKYSVNGSSSNFSKYVTDNKYGIVDNKTVLDLSDDAAHMNWGGRWRMPTREELNELKDYCTWTWTNKYGYRGCDVTGANGQSIFLFAGGVRLTIAGDTDVSDWNTVGYYWSSSLYETPFAYEFVFSSNKPSFGHVYRRSGLTIRPVYDEHMTIISVSSITMNPSSLSLTEDETHTLTATVSPSNASDKSVTWSSSNTTVATVSANGVVTAKKTGTATITVKANYGGKQATCSLTVKSKDISGSGNEGTGEENLF